MLDTQKITKINFQHLTHLYQATQCDPFNLFMFHLLEKVTWTWIQSYHKTSKGRIWVDMEKKPKWHIGSSGIPHCCPFYGWPKLVITTLWGAPLRFVAGAGVASLSCREWQLLESTDTRHPHLRGWEGFPLSWWIFHDLHGLYIYNHPEDSVWNFQWYFHFSGCSLKFPYFIYSRMLRHGTLNDDYFWQMNK